MKRHFTFLMAAFALMVLAFPLRVQADSYTITFKTGSGDGTSVETTTGCSNLVSSGGTYLSGNVVTATNVYYNGSDGLKLGKSSAGGTIKMNLSNSGQVTPTSIVVNAKRYNSGTAATLKVNGSATQSMTSSFADYTFNITSGITYLELISSKYIWVKSITVNYSTSGGGGSGDTGDDNTDVLNRAFTGITNTSYDDWTGTGISGAQYSGNSAGGYTSIQLRSTNSSGIVSTTSGGKVTKVVVTWNSNTAADRTLDIYGKNTAYSSASDLYNSNSRGTKLGSIVYGTSTTLNITGDYEYVGLRSSSGAMYLNEIQITWESQSTPTVATPTFTPAAGTYTEAQNVTISCATTGATIYYTTDGSTPNTSSSVYSSAIPVSSTTTIKAIAVKEGVSSEVATASYVFANPAAKTATYTITSINSVSAAGTVPSGSSASFVNTYTDNKFQLTAGNSMTLTLNGYQGKVITGVVLSMHSNSSKGAGSLSITAGSSSLASISGNFKPNWYSEWTTEFVDVNVPMTDDDYGIQSGEQLVITISATTNSLYCQSFTIQYEDDVNPRIIVTAPDPLAYDATSGAFNYSISNPVQGTSLQASSNADWISDIQVGDSQVTFTTTVNDTYLERNDTITLTYGTKTKDVIITQAALVPVITVSDAPTDAFSYEGDYGSFSFSIDHLVDEAIATAYSAEYWIRNFEVSDDMVYFEVARSIEDARSGNITLSYKLDGITLASVNVPISQEANPNEHGSFERPYTVTEAWTIINHMDDGVTADDSVYVAGAISQIEQVEVIQYHNANYKITDGNKTLYVRYGRNLDDTDFYDEDEIQEGDRVVICGKLQKHSSSPKYRIADYNYLVSIERDVEPPLFIPTSCMMANDEDALVYLYTNNEEEVVIYYTTNGDDPTTSSDIYSVDSGISLQGLTDEVTIKAIAYTLDGTKHSAVNSATYRMVSPNTHGLSNNPFTVQQALDSLDVSSTIEGVYVRGVVCADPEFSLSNFMNANYYIADNLGDDNQLYVFRGRYYLGDPFSSQEELMYGDIVTVFGDLTIYGQVKEFTAKNYIVSKERPSSIFIRPSEVSTNCRGISSSLNVYYNELTYIDSRDLQFCNAQGNQVEASTYSWLTATMNPNTGNIDFQIEDNDSNAPRTAYLKLVVMDNGNPTPFVSNVVPITQGICSADEFATLPFHYVGNEAVPAGITSDGLNENYGSSPYLKFDGVNDYMTLAFDEVPGELTFDIKGDGFKSSEFYLQTSTNNLDWDDVAIYTTQDMINSWAFDNPKREIARVIGSPMAQSFPELDENVRYIRWIMMTHSSSSKVRLGNIHLAKPIVYYNIAITQPTIDEMQVGTITTLERAQENETVNLSIEYDSDDYYFVEWVVTDDSNNPVAVTDNHFTMPAANVTVTATLVGVDTPCTYAFSTNGQIGDQQSVTVGEAVQMPTNSDITFNGQTFTFRGWTTDANDVTNLIRANSSYTIRQDVTFHAVYYQQVASTEAEKHYAKVTQELSDWSGDYLIVYEDGNVAFNGAWETLDAANNTVAVTIANGIIEATESVNAAKFTIAAIDGGYSIKSASGKYIGKDNNDNGLDESTEYDENYVNEISYNVDEGEIDIVGSGGAHLRFNSASNQNRFRYYKSATYGSQQPIQLYRYVGSVNNLYTRIFMNETADNITIEGPSIIPDGSVLEVTTITNNVGADRLLVDEGGQLVTSSDVNATVRKTITPYAEEHGTDNYYLIASPVDDLNPTTAGMTGDDFDLFAFDQSAQGAEWRNYKAEDSDHYHFNLEAGKGYLYANNYGGFINMGGTMAATANNVTITEDSGKPFAGLNLIGNPYPCNVTINKPFYRLEGGTALATLATDCSIAIAPMEGVFVCADGPETVSFTKAPTTSTTGGRNLLSMRVSRNRSSKDDRVETDNAIVRFGEGSLLRKLVLNPDLPQIYVAQDGADYAIVNAEAEGELPVSFRAATNGSYTFSVAAEGVTMRYLHLIDLKTGADVDLLQTPYYTFTAQTTDYESRFRLLFATGSSTSSETGNFAYYNGSQWMVSNEGKATLQVVDMMGRVLSSQNINGNAELNLNQAQGVYVLRLINNNEIKTQKIINY